MEAPFSVVQSSIATHIHIYTHTMRILCALTGSCVQSLRLAWWKCDRYDSQLRAHRGAINTVIDRATEAVH